LQGCFSIFATRVKNQFVPGSFPLDISTDP
jgi:hypothetical protein